MEPRKLYIADWHYGHNAVIKFDKRPFDSGLDEMNQFLVKQWNANVVKSDTVYILGDMFFCSEQESIEVLKKLNGRKFLIKGNHDRHHNRGFKDQFEKITDYMEVKDNGRNVVLCHYPILFFKNHYYGWYHLYGHVHETHEFKLLEEYKQDAEKQTGDAFMMYNVGCMRRYMGYTPRTLDYIISESQKGV